MNKNVLNTDLTGKVAVVTGAGGVLCSYFAKVLARAGAKVALLDLNDAAAEAIAEEIRAEGGIAKGFVTASLLFCVGSMAIVGALEGGLVGDHSLLYAKTVLDTVFAVVFAYSMGIGVALSAALILLYQGSIALLAQWVAPLLTADVIMTMSVVGSILIFGLGLKLLGLLKIKVLNHVPAVFVPMALVPLFELMGM